MFTCKAIRRRESNDVRDFVRADIDVAGFVVASLLEGGVDRYTRTHTHTHTYAQTHTHAHVYVYTYIHIHSYTCIHIYIYIYILYVE